MRAARSPVPPGHQECRRCNALVAVPEAVCLCPSCVDALTAAADLVERDRERRRRALATVAGIRFLAPDDAARLLGCTARRVRQLAQAGKLPTRRVLSRVYVREDAVLALIRESGPSSAA